MKRVSFIVIGLFILTGCGVFRCHPEQVIVRDSTIIAYKDSTIIRDSLVYVTIPQENSSNTLPSTQKSYLSTSLAESTAWIDSIGLLNHTLNNKQNKKLEILIPVKERFVAQAVSTRKEELQKQTVFVEKKLNWWQKFRLKSFWWLLAILVLENIIIIFALNKKFIFK